MRTVPARLASLLAAPALALSLLLAAAPARAQHLEPAIPRVGQVGSHWPDGQVMGEMSLFSESDFSVVGFHGYAWARLVPAFALEGTVGFLHATNGESHTSPTNPTVSAFYVGESRRTLLRVGAGISAPAYDRDAWAGGAVWWLARGMRDPWLVAPDHLSVVPAFRLDGQSRSFLWGFDADVALMFPTANGVTTEMMMQGGADFAARIHRAFHMGARLQMGWRATDMDESDVDAFQLSTVPFLRVIFGAGFVEGRVVINLDRPAGFSFDQDRLWLLQIRGGGRF